ncbi:NUDIX hydrolase [Abyssisolibacter fermentans]|uniref:NUDIX hydrolase n=1 Tax=Abyssisolibacter fermentans TaxID=1766203 RepID=UPI00083395AC|nr:NUDIX domain-containing protein [Abyssisolibacter fermentans]
MSDNYYWNLRKLVGKIPLNISSAGVIILDKKNRILLQHRTDDGSWSIPGGGLGLGENLEAGAKREVYEETNLIVEDIKLFNVYSGKEQHCIYPDGNEVYFTNVVYITKNFEGEMKADGIEGSELKFFNFDSLPKNIAPCSKPILQDLKIKLKSAKKSSLNSRDLY